MHAARNSRSAGMEFPLLDQTDRDEESQRFLPPEPLDFEDRDAASIEPEVPRHPRSWQWLAGPSQPRRLQVKPVFPAIQRLPIQLLDRHFLRSSNKVTAFAIFVLLWFIAFVLPLRISRQPVVDEGGRNVVNLDCIDTFWGRKNTCGPDGVNCQPFSNMSFAFRCPANCASVQVLNPRAVGPLEVNYQPLIVGSNIYRGDSFICAAALHAGAIDDRGGGCARVSLVGRHANYTSVERHGLVSIPFNSYFPLSFTISQDANLACHRESRGLLLAISLLFTAILSLSTTSPSWFFFPTFVGGFTHVTFVSDPPQASFHNTSPLPDHISIFAERLLPALFCAVILFWTCVRRTLLGLDAQVEKTLLWLGGFWFGALSNYTFGWLPIQRLTPHDLDQQPGAKLSLAIIIIVIVCIAAQQAAHLWLERRLLRYLSLYGLFLASILLCLVIPSVELRIHHYVIALLLLPGTSLQTRPSLLYQGLLLGLFVNGIARWGFASILQTPDALREDGAFNSLMPILKEPSILLGSTAGMASNISFTWEMPSLSANIDGISALVNDVERLRYFFPRGGASELQTFTWMRPPGLDLPEYFRFAFMSGGTTLDYTKAGSWFANGTWGAGIP